MPHFGAELSHAAATFLRGEPRPIAHIYFISHHGLILRLAPRQPAPRFFSSRYAVYAAYRAVPITRLDDTPPGFLGRNSLQAEK